MPNHGLNERQKRFVEAYLVCLSPTEAYRRAYNPKSPLTASADGSRLLAHPKVRAAIDERLRAQRLTADMELARLLRELEAIAFLDPSELVDPETGKLLDLEKMPEHARRAISAIENEEIFGRGRGAEHVGTLRKVKTWDKVGAIALRAKLAGLMTEKVEHSGTVNIIDPYAQPKAGGE